MTTTTEIITTNGNGLAPRGPVAPAIVTDEHRQILRQMVDRNATPAQVEMLILVGNRYDLDPLLGHVVLISGKVFVTHKGLIHKAHTSGVLDGMNTVYGKDEIGEWCESHVWRKDMTRPFIGRIYIQEYANSNPVWKSCRHGMAAKTAESFTMRRAFDVALTSSEEMGVVEAPDGTHPEPSPTERFVPPRQIAPPVRNVTDGPPACGGCGKALTKAQNDLSIRNYGEPLCPVCQREKPRETEQAPPETEASDPLANDSEDPFVPSDGSDMAVWEPAFADATALLKRLPKDVQKTFAGEIKASRPGVTGLADLGVRELKDFAAKCERRLDADSAPGPAVADGPPVDQARIVGELKALESEVQGLLDKLHPSRRATIMAQVEKGTGTRVLSQMTRADLTALKTTLQKHLEGRQVTEQDLVVPAAGGPGHGD